MKKSVLVAMLSLLLMLSSACIGIVNDSHMTVQSDNKLTDGITDTSDTSDTSGTSNTSDTSTASVYPISESTEGIKLENDKNKLVFLAGGCFWGTEKYISLIPGVVRTEVGYANGLTEYPTYEDVCYNNSGHAETVLVEYDPDKLELSLLLDLFYDVIDPTSQDRQGNDVGSQYRTGIYYIDDSLRDTIDKSISALIGRTDGTVVIEVMPLENYYTAEEYHQKYLDKNPDGYCHIGSAEFDKLEQHFSEKESSYTPEDHGYGRITKFSTIDLNGDKVTQSVFNDNTITFINYWATWCGPCRAELPDFPGMYEKYKDQVTFITIVDDGANNDSAKSLADEYLRGYVNLLPTADLLHPIQSGYVPTSVIVDSGGYLLIDKIIGAAGDYSAYIESALAIVNG